MIDWLMTEKLLFILSKQNLGSLLEHNSAQYVSVDAYLSNGWEFFGWELVILAITSSRLRYYWDC